MNAGLIKWYFRQFLSYPITIGIPWYFCIIAVMLVVFLLMKGKNCVDTRRRVVLSLYWGYILFVLVFAVFSRESAGVREANFELFWSYKNAATNFGYFPQIIENVLFFVPVGFLGIACIENMSWKDVITKGIAPGCLLSMSVELLQFIMCRGMFEFDDIINNSIGTIGGALLAFVSTRRLN